MLCVAVVITGFVWLLSLLGMLYTLDILPWCDDVVLTYSHADINKQLPPRLSEIQSTYGTTKLQVQWMNE